MIAAKREPFVYVYIVYYYDIETGDMFDRYHQVDPIPCASLKRASMFVKPDIQVSDLIEINRDKLWRHGNYWITKEPIIDSYNEGLERIIPFTNERLGNLKLE